MMPNWHKMAGIGLSDFDALDLAADSRVEFTVTPKAVTPVGGWTLMQSGVRNAMWYRVVPNV